jgi:hypothetical protein
MMVKHAENIRPDSYDRKNYHAYVRIIRILVAVFIFTFIVRMLLILYLNHHSPFDFVVLRICSRVPLTYPEAENKKIMRAWMCCLVSLSIFAIATLSCHVRIINYKRCHNMSYFSQFRQNIATMDQSLVATYLQIVLAIFYEVFSSRAS